MKLTLTRLELQYLDDALTMHTGDDNFLTLRQIAPSATNAANFELLLEISRAIVKIDNENLNSADIDIDEENLWILRETANYNLQFPKVPDAGVQLKLKIHRAIQECCLNNLLEDAFGEMPLIIDEPDLSEGHNVSTDSGSSPNQSSNKAFPKTRKTIRS